MKKNIKHYRPIWLLALLLLAGCQSDGADKKSTTVNTGTVQVDALSQVEFQTMAHFGASDAWSCQFVGLWPESKKREMATWLFSQEMDENGQPKGIGLSLWRFNIGAGSAEQGAESGIGDPWRRAESFLEPDGSYNWSRQAGQVWFAKAAQEYGVEHLLVFPNSPPVNFTKNGKAYAQDGVPNLASDQYDPYAVYLTEVILGLENKGLKVDYISPVNEPQWDWSDGGQEGTPFYNAGIFGIVKALNARLEEAGLTTKIDVAEAGKINYLYEDADKPQRGSQIKAFFSADSELYLGELSHVGQAISGHSYFTTSPYTAAIQQRESLKAALDAAQPLDYWMSEYCILGDNGGEINGNGRDLGIDPALYMARVIHNDLKVAGASAWHWWLGISPYDYKDGLIYIDHEQENENYMDSKMLWALGNYSRFVRPGYKRVEVMVDGAKSQSPDLLITAFQSPSKKKTVYVMVNSGIKPSEVALSVDGTPAQSMQVYITSKDQNLAPVSPEANEVTLPARSIATIVLNQ